MSAFRLKHMDGIAAYCDHPVRFGVVESINTTIKAVIRRATTGRIWRAKRCFLGCPFCPPGLRPLFFRWGYTRLPAAGPSEEGGLDEFVESFFRPANRCSRSAIFLSRSASSFSSSADFLSRRSAFLVRLDKLRFVLRDLFLEVFVQLPETADFSPHFLKNGGEALRKSGWDTGIRSSPGWRPEGGGDTHPSYGSKSRWICSARIVGA